MPDNDLPLLEWNEENLNKVVSDLYAEAETDRALHDQLMANAFEVLRTKIDVPETYRGGIFSRERNRKTMVMYVPAFDAAREAMPAGTTSSEPQPDYEIVCTFPIEW